MVDEEFNAELEDGAASSLTNEAGRPRVRKAADAFRTISEVADELHVPQHVLRFWETKFPQVRPLKRGGGRRYYRPEDVGLLRRVADLLYTQGYTIKGVQRLLRDGGMTTEQPERNPAPAQDLLLPLDPPPHREPSPPAAFQPFEPEYVPELQEPEHLPEEAESAFDLAPIPEPARPQPVAQAPGQDELAQLRALLTETLAALEEIRRTLG
ncbi:MAG: MerR family transcriptional regulator [Rhodospirillales bacterium]|nr:MerR family transcriptional regulator [Rhodospirillales bacterium]